ncbi:hypothetical protein [Streptomyces sp. NRRL F-2799]|uniref:hypothetical protein n=1 Tax=Streptomyces sp. NRRL F-2799 TaxID=1463844 RepID=UPI00131A4A8C|nr:hypothetical protein [Streptomyces sp. NRRL F-2799]
MTATSGVTPAFASGSGPALTNNDEALLKVDDPGICAGYVTHYNAVRAAASPGIADNNPACKGVTEAPDARSGSRYPASPARSGFGSGR